MRAFAYALFREILAGRANLMEKGRRVTPLISESDSRLPFGVRVGHSQCSPDTRVRIGAKGTRRWRAEKKKETCVWHSTATLYVSQVNLLPDTAEHTSVEDVANGDQCVIAFSAVFVQC